MRRAILIAGLVVFALWAVPASAGRTADVAVWQYGVASTSRTVQASNFFTLDGRGFRTWTPAKICLTGQYPCLSVEADNSGSFKQLEILYYPGTYLIHVYQQKSRSGGKADLAYSGELTVVI